MVEKHTFISSGTAEGILTRIPIAEEILTRISALRRVQRKMEGISIEILTPQK